MPVVPRDAGDDTNYRTPPGDKSHVGNALNSGIDADNIPVKDGFKFIQDAKPNTNQPPPPSAIERSRGYVKSRGG